MDKTIESTNAYDQTTLTELTGKTVITRHHPQGTVTYGGLDEYGGTSMSTSFGAGGTGWTAYCHPLSVAPADEATIREASDPVAKANAGAVKYDYKFHGAPSWFRWQATLKGLPFGCYKTKTEALTAARVALAVHEWHEARAAATDAA